MSVLKGNSMGLNSYPNGVLHSMTFVAQHEIGDIYEVTTAYEPTFHILFIISSTYRSKYKLTAALFGRPRQETLLNSKRYFGKGKGRLLVPEAP
jgi:hypothetical protein